MPDGDPELVKLIHRAGAGDRAALGRLLGQFSRLAYQQAISILRDPHRAEDATQEALIAAYLGLQNLRDPEAFGAWLAGIVRHQCHRILRRRDLEWVELNPDRADNEQPRDELCEQVLDAVQTLPVQQRDVMRLYYVSGCSQLEVAAFLSVPVSTVNNRLSAARRALRERIVNMTRLNPDESIARANVLENVGRVMEVNESVVTVRFESSPADIFDAVAVADGGKMIERMRVAQRLDDGVVRCLVTDDAVGIVQGTAVLNTRSVGIGLTPWSGAAALEEEQLKRAVEVLSAATQPRSDEILETGIKPLDLFCPLCPGGRLGIFGIQGVGRIVLVEELIRRLAPKASVDIFYLVHRNEPDSVRDMLTKEKGYPGDRVGQVNVFWMLSDSASDVDAAREMRVFDAAAFCTPVLGAQGLYPAIDPLAARSRLIEENRISAEHGKLLDRLHKVLGRAKELMADPVMLEYIACRAPAKARQRGEAYALKRLAELRGEDRLLVQRARKVERFLTTPFFVAEPFANAPGQHVSLAQTIAGCNAILDGELDDVAESALLYVGVVEEARQRTKAG